MSFGTGTAIAQDWPQWRGPARDGSVAGFAAPDSWPDQLSQRWKAEVGLGEASPVLVGDRVYAFGLLGSDETIVCLDAASGDVKWQDKHPTTRVEGGAREHPGPRATPAVGEGRVCTLGVGGVLSCLDAESGMVVWRKDSSEFPNRYPRFYTGASPLIVNGMCLAYLGGSDGGAFVAYDLNSGEQKWSWSGETPSYGSPVLAEMGGTLLAVTLSESSLLGIDVADGSLAWKYDFPARQHTATPVVRGDLVFCTARGTGTTAIRVTQQGDRLAADHLWTRERPNPRYTSCIVKDGLVYGADSAGAIYCLDAETGEQKWAEATRRGVRVALVDAGPVLMAATAESNLLVFQPGGDSLTPIANFKVADSPIWSYPIVSGDRIFVKDHDSVILWTLN